MVLPRSDSAGSSRTMMPGLQPGAFHVKYEPGTSSRDTVKYVTSSGSVHSTFSADTDLKNIKPGSNQKASFPGAFSVSSTHSISSPSSKFLSIAPSSNSSSSITTPSPSKQSKPVKRRVRFHEARNEWFESKLHWEDAGQIWYKKADYADFHACMVSAVMEIAQNSDDSTRIVLHHLLDACLKSESDDELLLSREETRRFQNLYRSFPDLVGIERNVCYPLSKDRSQRREALVELVEDTQSYGWPSPEVEAQKVAQVSSETSLPSRLVARWLALGITVRHQEEQQEREQENKKQEQEQQQQRTKTLPQEEQRMVEISPELSVRLRGAAETRACIEQDFFIPTMCLSCSVDIFVIQDASYVLCPHCRVVSPLPQNDAYGEGLGLGFTFQSLETIHKEKQHSLPQRRGSH